MRKSKVVLLLLMSVLLVCFSIGCKSEPSTAKPQVTNYTVTFNANGGSGTMPAQTFAKDETKSLSANTFTMTNKVFTGWNTKADGTGTSYTDAQNYTATGNITLFAQWADVAFVVTFDKNDGSGEKVPQQFAAGIPQNLKANTFTITDKFFTGWNTKADGTGTSYADGQSYTATADITLYAQWRDLYIYTVTFDKNDGSGTTETKTQTFTEGQAQNLKAFASMFTTPDAMKFVSWNTKADGSGTSYTDGQSYTATANITLYAQWDFAYLCFTAEVPGLIGMEIAGTLTPEPTLEYSRNGVDWRPFEYLRGSMIVCDATGDKIYLRGNNNSFSGEVNTSGNRARFVMTGKFAVSGNIMSLLDKTCRLESLDGMWCFYRLFYDCSSLTTAPELPATTLGDRCFACMFENCTSLTEAPELPATALNRFCYSRMFAGCTSLTEAPELPATTLAEDCYNAMFYGCTSLTEVPDLHATTLAQECCSNMFTGCTSLTEAPQLPAKTLKMNCYSSMFSGCTSLTKAPELSATMLESYCYRHMFSGCTSLTEAPELPATTPKTGCYENMFKGCMSLCSVKVNLLTWGGSTDWLKDVKENGTFICPESLPQTIDSSHIPSGWTIETF